MTVQDVLTKALKTAQDQGAVGWVRYLELADAVRRGDMDEALLLADVARPFDVTKTKAYLAGRQSARRDNDSQPGGITLCQVEECPRAAVGYHGRQWWGPDAHLAGMCEGHQRQAAEDRAERERVRLEQVMSVECPFCGAGAGLQCVSTRTGDAVDLHRYRYKAAPPVDAA